MKPAYLIPLTILSLLPAMAHGAPAGPVGIRNVETRRAGEEIRLTADIVLDSLRLGRNRQLYITPVLESGDGATEVLPSLLVNGHAMHIAYERRNLPGRKRDPHVVGEELKRLNGKPQTVRYVASVQFEKWMWNSSAEVRWTIDTCGCGALQGSSAGYPSKLGLNPVGGMRGAYVTPEVTALPVSVHEGNARVQFEVAKSVLHTEPYVCRSGQRIDNRHELRVIDDSISYALTDPNVEIAGIRICGYASPEGTYLSNVNLSTDRSRALAEYLGQRYSLPKEQTEYSAVPENWEGLREIVETAPDITPDMRRDLLELIDRPAYGPADYDEKDRILRTDPRFATLYKTKILPEWYPRLRTTRFEISTRLKPLSDEELAKVIETSPEKMSLNQMFRVARLYPEGSEEFNRVIATALRYYPEDETANLNAAVAALRREDYRLAKTYLAKAGDSAEALNALGIVACAEGDIDVARRLFREALPLPEAAKNLEMLGD